MAEKRFFVGFKMSIGTECCVAECRMFSLALFGSTRFGSLAAWLTHPMVLSFHLQKSGSRAVRELSGKRVSNETFQASRIRTRLDYPIVTNRDSLSPYS